MIGTFTFTLLSLYWYLAESPLLRALSKRARSMTHARRLLQSAIQYIASRALLNQQTCPLTTSAYQHGQTIQYKTTYGVQTRGTRSDARTRRSRGRTMDSGRLMPRPGRRRLLLSHDQTTTTTLATLGTLRMSGVGRVGRRVCGKIRRDRRHW